MQDRPEGFRLSTQAMTVMLAVLDRAGALVDDPPPKLPSWPPVGLDEQRGAAIPTNEGWIILPIECGAIARALRRVPID